MPAFTSKERLCTVLSPLGDDVLLLSHMTGHESLSQLFRFQCEFLSDKKDIDFKSIIGQKICFEISLVSGEKRQLSGHVARFSQGGSKGRYTAYSAEVVPWLWFLTRTSDCKIFQDKSVPEIIEAVFQDYGFSDFQLPTSTFPKKHYCVQYRETDFNFVSRLMEEAGISYFFKHGDKAHTLVCFSKPDDNPECAGQKSAVYARTSAGGEPVGDIDGWDVEHELPPGAYTSTDFNMENPSTDLEASSPSTIQVGSNEAFELYDYPGEYQTVGEGGDVTRVRIEAEEAASVEARASTSCAAFSPGYCFELVGHYRRDYNVSYLLRDVTHRISQDFGESAGEGSSYSNDIVCLPHSIPFRPLQSTAKPVISGVQTATIVGASGEEIDVDEHGRVVVQFHWDRYGEKNENSSCRIRVSQNWAGKNWGAVFNPRIGQEVIVDFLEGDPDRPIIVGRVYNGEQKVPYELPANKTQSGIKSRSSKEGTAENFNEIRMEDKKDEELFYIQAEKDQKILVKNDRVDDVGNDELRTVGGSRTRNVAKDESVEIGNDRGLTIGGLHTIEVTKDHILGVGGNENHTVEKNRELGVNGKDTISVGEDHSLSVKGNQVFDITKDQVFTVDADQTFTIKGLHKSDVTEGYGITAKEYRLEADKKITLKTGSAEIVMESNGNITLKGKKINLKATGDLIIKGSKIKEN